MSQTFREHRYSHVPMRRLHAGTDPSRSDHGDQCAERTLMRSEYTPRRPLYVPDLACALIRRSHPASITSILDLGAAIKSP